MSRLAFPLLSLSVFMALPAAAFDPEMPIWCEGEKLDSGNELNYEKVVASLKPGEGATYSAFLRLMKSRFEDLPDTRPCFANEPGPSCDAARHFSELLGLALSDPDQYGAASFVMKIPLAQQTSMQPSGELALPRQSVPLSALCSEDPLAYSKAHPIESHIFHAAAATQRALSSSPPDLSSIATLRRRARDYETLATGKALPMWPWELFVNGLLTSPDLNQDPPQSQWVLLRPSVGTELSAPSQAKTELAVSGALEPVGYVRYIGPDDNRYSRWVGVSLLLTAGSEDNGAGIGGLLRYNNYFLGVTARSGTSDLFVYIGLDFYKVVEAARK